MLFASQAVAALFVTLHVHMFLTLSHVLLVKLSVTHTLKPTHRFDQSGSSMHIAPLSERGGGGGGRQDRRVTFAQIAAEGLGTSGQADWVQVRTGVVRVAAWEFACGCYEVGDSNPLLVPSFATPLPRNPSPQTHMCFFANSFTLLV